MLPLPTKRIIAAAALIIGVAALVLAAFRWGAPLWYLLRDRQQLDALILSWGAWAGFGMVALQVAQIVAAPLPGNLVAIVAGYVFGPGKGLVLCMAGVIIGSVIAFYIGRLFGRRVLQVFVSNSVMNRFDTFMVRRGPFFFFLLLLFPNPIGDWLSYLGGLAALPLPVFVLLVFAGRLPSNALEVFIGWQMNRLGKQGYDLAWWQWTGIAAALILIATLYYLNRKRIEAFFMRFTKFPQ